MPTSDEPAATRDRLIAAAGEVFARLGYRDATVREICAAAGANVAAVNYHFRDKSGLYAAVLESAYVHAERSYPFDLAASAADGQVAPSDLLFHFVHIMLLRMMDVGKPAWHGRLMAREMMEPTEALDMIVEQTIRPKRDALVRIVGAILGEHTPRSVVESSARSVIGQTLFYHQNCPVIKRLFPELPMDREGIRAIAAHITAFSLAGMRGLQGTKVDGGNA